MTVQSTCLEASAIRSGCRLSPSLSMIGGGIVCSAVPVPYGIGSFDRSFDLSFDTVSSPDEDFIFRLVPGGLAVSATRIPGMTVSFGQVCEVGVRKYLKVAEEWLFLVPENMFTADQDIYSNVEWNIT